jgi:large subunit ribosomal protein L18
MDKKAMLRLRRHGRIRARIAGNGEKPRLNVFRSVENIYVQIIDDDKGQTLVSASTIDPEAKKAIKRGGNKEAAKFVGQLIGKRAVEKGIEAVVFDRGGNRYHGRVAALADGAREAGLKF